MTHDHTCTPDQSRRSKPGPYKACRSAGASKKAAKKQQYLWPLTKVIWALHVQAGDVPQPSDHIQHAVTHPAQTTRDHYTFKTLMQGLQTSHQAMPVGAAGADDANGCICGWYLAVCYVSAGPQILLRLDKDTRTLHLLCCLSLAWSLPACSGCMIADTHTQCAASEQHRLQQDPQMGLLPASIWHNAASWQRSWWGTWVLGLSRQKKPPVITLRVSSVLCIKLSVSGMAKAAMHCN